MTRLKYARNNKYMTQWTGSNCIGWCETLDGSEAPVYCSVDHNKHENSSNCSDLVKIASEVYAQNLKNFLLRFALVHQSICNHSSPSAFSLPSPSF